MNTRNIGRSGLRVSAIGLGCNNFGHTVEAATSRDIIHRALDLGITLFDTAPIYGAEWGASERILGEALGSRRRDVAIVTKFGLTPGGGPDTSRSAVIDGIEQSLRRLGTDYVDLFLLHWPDESTPMEETLRALDDVVRSGKARYTGCCNLPAWRVVEAKWLARSAGLNEFIVAQDEYSLAHRGPERGLLPALREYAMGLMPYAPLANGLLTGKFSRGEAAAGDSRLKRNQWNTGDRYLTARKLDLAARLERMAAERGRSLLELAVSWLLAQPAVCSVIAGATRLEQLEGNAGAGGWALTPEELEQVDRICRDADAVGD